MFVFAHSKTRIKMIIYLDVHNARPQQLSEIWQLCIVSVAHMSHSYFPPPPVQCSPLMMIYRDLALAAGRGKTILKVRLGGKVGMNPPQFSPPRSDSCLSQLWQCCPTPTGSGNVGKVNPTGGSRWAKRV